MSKTWNLRKLGWSLLRWVNRLGNLWYFPFFINFFAKSLDPNGNKIFIQKNSIDCKPIRDLKTGVPGAEKDPRVLENLINNMNMTTNDKNMWLVPFNRGGKICISIEFQINVSVAGYYYNFNFFEIFIFLWFF